MSGLTENFGAKYLFFCLLSFCQNERICFLSSFIFFEESVFIFQFLNDKMHNYVNQNINIVHFL